jgi:acetyl esterase/lipase
MSLNAYAAIVVVALFAGVAGAQTAAPAMQPAPQRVKLWDVTPGVVAGNDTDADPTDPTIDIYPVDPAKATGAAILVFPGGGYTHLSTVREGSDVARMLVDHGIAAFVVRYRHSPRYVYPAPMDDARRAIRTVRANAAEYKIDPKRIGAMGFSAGGHLVATVGTQFDAGKPDSPDPIERISSRPDFLILTYPVITFTDPFAHKGSRTALLGANADPAQFDALSAEKNVSANTPPTIIIHSSSDTTVPVENSILFYQALRKNKVPAEIHIFEIGGHGFGLAPTDPALRIWPELVMDWMSKNKWIPAKP